MSDTVKRAKQDILEKALEALERSRAAELDARLEVQKWEAFINEFTKRTD